MKKVQLFLFILVLLAIPIRSHAQDAIIKVNASQTIKHLPPN